ncbi:hypothetical protein NPIL_498781 [Nephila pilipes]|uniref:Uncharacterized protein n=1 Tax=Nephila pilipes TaxID=299642 RepID=A0A8X6T7K8_NEPPI|nr:hypothetical protein NPIL_71221 [Nephila pilipes]GFS82074.1 hypothetical protein NPIL_325981 [Nephila pilipes]GFT93857.1 hypothetical protein NPIL_679031 [Nephila pilipes]GFU46631.1 hypothetical protein NPIL_498781 [Nephila pilipes]
MIYRKCSLLLFLKVITIGIQHLQSPCLQMWKSLVLKLSVWDTKITVSVLGKTDSLVKNCEACPGRGRGETLSYFASSPQVRLLSSSIAACTDSLSKAYGRPLRGSSQKDKYPDLNFGNQYLAVRSFTALSPTT